MFLTFLKQNALIVLSFGYVKKQNLHCLQYAALSLSIIFITVCRNFLVLSLARKLSKNDTSSIKNHMYFFNTESNSQCLGVLFDISFDIPFEYGMKVLYGCKIFALKISLCFEKTFMIIKKTLLVENILHQGKSLGLQKTSLNGLSLFEKIFFDEGKILACGRKLPR